MRESQGDEIDRTYDMMRDPVTYSCEAFDEADCLGGKLQGCALCALYPRPGYIDRASPRKEE